MGRESWGEEQRGGRQPSSLGVGNHLVIISVIVSSFPILFTYGQAGFDVLYQIWLIILQTTYAKSILTSTRHPLPSAYKSDMDTRNLIQLLH